MELIFFSVLVVGSKIIELSGLEFQKLQMNMKKVHQQNFQLAQANSHMLAVGLFYVLH